MTNKTTLQRHIRVLVIFFMCALALSGLTAIPLQYELKLLMPFVAKISNWGMAFPAMKTWIERINDGVQNGYGQFPFLAYGTDWLAFGHIAIAIAFVGVLRCQFWNDCLPAGRPLDIDFWDNARNPVFLAINRHVFWAARHDSLMAGTPGYPNACAGTVTKFTK